MATGHRYEILNNFIVYVSYVLVVKVVCTLNKTWWDLVGLLGEAEWHKVLCFGCRLRYLKINQEVTLIIPQTENYLSLY